MPKDRSALLLREPNLYKAFLLLAAPIFGANFMRALNELVDTYFIGQMAQSASAQAGVSISWPLLNIFTSFQVGFAVAGIAVVSQLLGAKQEERARENAGLLIGVALLFGIALHALLYLAAPVILTGMGARGASLAFSITYVRVRSFELLFTFLFTAFQAIRQAQGDTVTPVLLSLGAVILNIILTATFVQGLGLGVFGAGLATVLGNIAICPVCLYLRFSPRQPLFLTPHHLRIHREPLRTLTVIATPAAGSQALSSLGFLILQSIIYSYGEPVTAAFSIGNKVSNLLLMPVLALGTVLAAYVGQNIGAGNGSRAKQAYLVSRNVGLCLTIFGSLLLLPFRNMMAAALSNDTATRIAASEYMFWVLLTQPLMSLFQNYLGVFNGAGRTKYAFLMSTARLWAVRLPLILFFKTVLHISPVGVWYAMVISNFIIILLGAFLFRRVEFSPFSGLTVENRTVSV